MPYRQADITLLDDCLSALDARVSAEVFDNCIRGHLAGRTIILVVNQLGLCEQADTVVVMRDGMIFEQVRAGLIARQMWEVGKGVLFSHRSHACLTP